MSVLSRRGLFKLLLAAPLLRAFRPAPEKLSLLDFAKYDSCVGICTPVVKALSQRNTLLQDVVWIEEMDGLGHRISYRTVLPRIAWRRP